MNNSKKLRILHVLKSSIYSGAENVVITIMKELRNEFEMIYVATDGEIRTWLEQEQLAMELLPRFDRPRLQAVVQRYKPDIIHAHDFSAGVLCASVKGQFCLISHLHYDPPWVTRWNWKTVVFSLCKSRIDRVITVTDRSFEAMVFADIYRCKQVTLSNPVDQERIRRMAEGPEEEGQCCDLIFVGRLVEQKNPQRFIRLVAQLKARGFLQIRAWMLGDGELFGECNGLICEMGLQENIEMKGFQGNPYWFIRRSKLLCITSGWEGFGLVAVEANILGVPVLSTRNSGCTEVLGEHSPELCATDEEFVQKAELLLRNQDEMELWKNRSRRRSQQLITIAGFKEELKRIYTSEDLK